LSGGGKNPYNGSSPKIYAIKNLIKMGHNHFEHGSDSILFSDYFFSDFLSARPGF